MDRGEMKLVGGRIPRGIWWNGGGGWEDGTSLLKFRVRLEFDLYIAKKG